MKTVQMGPISKFKQRATHLALGLGLAATLAFSAVMPALADDINGTSAVTGGAMAITDVSIANAAFNVTLDGTNQAPTLPVTVKFKDDRGTGAGWKLTVAATTFIDGSKSLADEGTFSISSRTATTQDGTGTYTNPANATTVPMSLSNTPIPVTTALSTPGAATIINANEDTGMGHFAVTPTMKVAIPANAKAGTYASTITYTIQTGP